MLFAVPILILAIFLVTVGTFSTVFALRKRLRDEEENISGQVANLFKVAAYLGAVAAATKYVLG